VLFDAYGRPLTNLRVMVTGRCNFACFFCHMEGYREGYNPKNEINLEELEVLALAARKLEIKAFKITGGEPTVRDDLPAIVKLLKSYKFYVSMTTNASLLDRHIEGLAEAGLDHVNVSLHSLSDSVFEKITGRRMLQRVLANLKLVRDYGIPLKINFVLLKGLNENDIPKLVDLAASLGAKLQLIELHPVGRAVTRFKEHYLPRWRVLEKIEDRVVEIKYRVGLHNRPILILDNGVEVELVGPVGNCSFCAACTRVRVTYDFKLIPCLNWREEPVAVRPMLKNARNLHEKVDIVIQALRQVNRLRRPYVLCPVKGKPFTVKKTWRIARLGLPKSSGELNITGRRAQHVLKLLVEEWGSYTS
jgi:cyclic pyranopterin phosphate synthase